MKKVRDFITHNSTLIVVICTLLLIPAIIGYVKTRTNYDILVYLPDDIDTIKGENVLTDEFKLGSYAFVMTDNMSNKQILNLENKIKKINGVNNVFSVADVIGTSLPKEILPDELQEKLYSDNSTIIMVTFDGSTSEDKTINALEDLRKLTNPDNISSMTAMVLDTMNLSDSEVLIYVAIAVVLCLIVLLITTDSYVIPFLLLGNIGVAILYNMGSNIFLGQISYITKAITAILQLGVTMDFSIFLYHKYEQYKDSCKDNKEAMSLAIKDTFISVLGSSLTTVAGFLALCSMDLTLGKDIGIVMAKGVICGVIVVLTLFPSLLLMFDNLITKTKHKNIFPSFKRLQKFSVNHSVLIIIIFVLLMIPAYIGNNNFNVYYKLDESLPDNLAFKKANATLKEQFNIVSPEMILIDKNLTTSEVESLTEELKNVEGIDLVLAPNSILDFGLPIEMLPDDLTNILDNDKYQLVIVNSSYEIASDELNSQIDEIKDIVYKYDSKGIIAGEGPLMKDLVEIADHDFKMVNYISIIVIFIIMIFVLKSISLPIILVFSIEFAIFANMSFAYFTNTSLPFIASIVVGTIQLGATIDYAILMSNKYLNDRKEIGNKYAAMTETLRTTIPSIIVSALCFFAATVGVAAYTKIDMIGAICELLCRGSIISMLVVILILPSLLLTFDKIIMKTTLNTKEVKYEK